MITATSAERVGWIPDGFTLRLRQVEIPEGGESRPDSLHEVSVRTGFLNQGCAKDVADLVFHGAAVTGGTYSQRSLQGLVEVADGDAGH
jgi:hypothetical protein